MKKTVKKKYPKCRKCKKVILKSEDEIDVGYCLGCYNKMMSDEE